MNSYCSGVILLTYNWHNTPSSSISFVNFQQETVSYTRSPYLTLSHVLCYNSVLLNPMMSHVKDRLKLVKQLCDSDGMEIDGIHCLSDSESCWTWLLYR